MLEGFHRLKVIEIGFRRRHHGVLGRQIAVLGIGVLPRHRALRQKLVPALGGDFRQFLIGNGGVEVGLALRQLSVKVGRVQIGQQLADLHRRADIDIPFPQIAAHAGIDRRIDPRLHVTRQDQGAAFHIRQGYQLHGADVLIIGPIGGAVLVVEAQANAAGRDHGRHAKRRHRPEFQPGRRRVAKNIGLITHRFLRSRRRLGDGARRGIPGSASCHARC